ncbi:ATP-binding cassette domain-containing protein [Chelatococcus sambhunathii]|uniref:ATP-binding cassette domain-containing protein n=1 Tax=Chelatococcus sambhunathii TaxID=363953 RepID=A0ABU1DBR0_9HYPH|nr:ATP-binding cassette domain-containing protein [Chelatococcus sambhunathii]MDR4305549.1 ATP-binding cassette domain-containing protein [Chelatococcus sambhunathii]
MTAATLSGRARATFAFAPADRGPPAKPASKSPAKAGAGAPISVRGLSKSFGTKEVLTALDLTVPAGQFLAIVGRSGCGKSTLLRTLVGLEQPTSGAVMVGDGQRGVGRIMFQEPRLLPWQRVVDNVRVGLSEGLPKAASKAQALDALGEVGLADRAGEWPSVLSGGQKQRVALARALVSRPKLLALDEPLGALDALTRIEMQSLIERVWLEQRFTAVLVTHDVAEALALADRVVLIEDGRIALDIDVDLPRPRRRGSAEIGALEGRILDHLFSSGGRPSDDRPGFEPEPVEYEKAYA